MAMKLLTKAIRAKLRSNYTEQCKIRQEGGDETDFYPVVKLFTPDGNATWLLTELADDDDTLFGLCDLGMQCPEIGYVSLGEIVSVRGKLGLPVERDMYFKADKGLAEYALEAAALGYIRT